MPSTVPGTRQALSSHLLDEGIEFLWSAVAVGGSRATCTGGAPTARAAALPGLPVGVGEWVCAGVCAVERASERERRAGRSSQRRAEPAAPAGPGSLEVGGPCRQSAHGVPIGRPRAALRREGGEEPKSCSRAGAGAPGRVDAGVDARDPHPPPPLVPSLRSRRRPASLRRPRSASDSFGGTRAAPGRPGEWPRALPGFSRAPPPAFAFAAAARWGLPGQRPGQLGRPRPGQLDCGEQWDRSQEAPPGPRAGWEQVARAGPGALCRGAETGSRRPRLPRPLPSLPCSPGRPRSGSAG